MELSLILPFLRAIKGCTFASIDAMTKPAPGIRKETTGERVLLFNSRVSGYEKMVRRRLSEIGRDPDSFIVGDLPWGLRLPDEPGCLIVHKGVYYVQTILLSVGRERFYSITGNEISAEVAAQFLPRSGLERSNGVSNSQGLPNDRAVRVHTYALNSITGIRLLGESLAA